jgi:uracil phosphoribosyltransferase
MIPKTLQQSVRWKQLEHEDFQATGHEAQNMLTLQATAKDHKKERYEVDCPKPMQCSRRNKYVAIQARCSQQILRQGTLTDAPFKSRTIPVIPIDPCRWIIQPR